MEFATSLFSTASSLVARSQLASSYTLASAQQQQQGHPPPQPPIQVGVWKVERATHNSNGKQVSIWTCERSSLVASSSGSSSGGRSGSTSSGASANARRLEKAIDVLKKETSSLSRLRHPCILEMAEPMEETRSYITFATEPVTASLRQAISASASAADSSRRGRRSESDPDLELDEVEIQKGLSQVGKGLQFLHESAKLVHGNLTTDSIIINSKGDWKLSGFGLSTYLFGPDGVPAKWEFPEHDYGIPASCQRDYDYIAPEYILDESSPAPSNDLYSLGCVIHAIHTRTGPPFSNRNNLENARTNIEDGLSRGLVRPQWRKLNEEAQSVLSQLVTRYPSSRLSATTFLAHSYFSSLLVSTLRFLERDSFAAQSSEAQASFLKGLVGVLPRFSDKVNRRKVLPCLLEETRKAGLVPFLLPNILYIAGKMDTDTFRTEALPQIKPLFAIKEPPQAVISLLDNLPLFIEKCTPAVFREGNLAEVMPLVYGALESDNPVVLERALKTVPSLCETLDYTVSSPISRCPLFTTINSISHSTLICFHSMIKILDKFTLTEKLVPLLAKIKTKEPSVMVATLAVHEEMGKKCEIEAIATLILPQLWAMSMGPLLNAAQFAKFMAVIKRLGTRVEEEHSKHLNELKRLEDSASGNKTASNGQEVDFESLVRGGGGLWAEENRVSRHIPLVRRARS
ncbi:kinase-like protein [Meredithblackwellia eburnea MCA 4105]